MNQSAVLTEQIEQNPVHLLQFGCNIDALNLSQDQFKFLGELSPEKWMSFLSVVAHENNLTIPENIKLQSPDATDFATTQSVLTGLGAGVAVVCGLAAAVLGFLSVLMVLIPEPTLSKVAAICFAAFATFFMIAGAVIGGFLYLLAWLIQPELQSGIEVGGKGGKLFFDNVSESSNFGPSIFGDNAKPTQWEICQVDVWGGNVIDAIQCHWRGKQGTSVAGQIVSGQKHGGNDGTLHTFTLAQGEYITALKCKVGIRVDSIIFRTNLRDSEKFGGEGGDREFTLDGPVVGFRGREGVVLDAIGVQLPVFQHTLLCYGGNGGIPFAYDLTGMKRIRSVTVWHGDYIDGIQITWERLSDGAIMEGAPYGRHALVPGGKKETFTLADDEVITCINVISDVYVDKLIFHTNKDNHYPFGGNSGNGQPTIDLTNKKLLGFVGRYTKYLDSFGVLLE